MSASQSPSPSPLPSASSSLPAAAVNVCAAANCDSRVRSLALSHSLARWRALSLSRPPACSAWSSFLFRIRKIITKLIINCKAMQFERIMRVASRRPAQRSATLSRSLAVDVGAGVGSDAAVDVGYLLIIDLRLWSLLSAPLICLIESRNGFWFSFRFWFFSVIFFRISVFGFRFAIFFAGRVRCLSLLFYCLFLSHFNAYLMLI